MSSSEHILSPDLRQDSGNDLADFLMPIEHGPMDFDSLSREPPVFPAVFYLPEKITDSVQQVHLALARFNASLSGPSVFRHDGHLVRVVRNEDGEYTVVPLYRNRLRLVLSEAGTWKRFLKDSIAEPDNALLDAAISASPERYRLIPVLAGLYHGVLLRADGSVVSTDGFDAVTGFFWRLRMFFLCSRKTLHVAF